MYPALIAFLSKILSKPLHYNTDYQPDLTVVISFFNEEKMIEDCIRSVYNSGYPLEKLRIFAASDGSTDNSVSILKSLTKEYPTLKLFEFGRLGKNAVLNKIVPLVETELIFYLDADSRPQKGTIGSMVLQFSDNNVGSVISSLRFVNEFGENAGGRGEVLYQSYEAWIRTNESLISTTVNSLGNFYAIKQYYYNPIPNDLAADDYIPILDVISKGARVIFDNKAITNEVRGKSLTDEYSRRVRTSAAGLSAMWYAKHLLLPKYGWSAFFLWSHKLLRWLSPLFLFVLLFSTLMLDNNSNIFYFFAASQIILYTFAFIGWILEKFSINIFPIKMCLYFVTMNLGFLVGIIRFLSRKQNARWDGHKSI